MKSIKKIGEYRLYRIEGCLELWKGSYGGKYSYRAGYVSNSENIEHAIDVAKEEIASLMAQGI